MTWQTKRHKKQQRGRPQLGPDALRAKRERADSRRMAMPAPVYRPDQVPGEQTHWVEFGCTQGPGWVVHVPLHTPSSKAGRRPRCDSRTAVLDGATVITGGWHAICRWVIENRLPRSLPARAYAGLHVDCSASDLAQAQAEENVLLGATPS